MNCHHLAIVSSDNSYSEHRRETQPQRPRDRSVDHWQAFIMDTAGYCYNIPLPSELGTFTKNVTEYVAVYEAVVPKLWSNLTNLPFFHRWKDKSSVEPTPSDSHLRLGCRRSWLGFNPYVALAGHPCMCTAAFAFRFDACLQYANMTHMIYDSRKGDRGAFNLCWKLFRVFKRENNNYSKSWQVKRLQLQS